MSDLREENRRLAGLDPNDPNGPFDVWKLDNEVIDGKVKRYPVILNTDNLLQAWRVLRSQDSEPASGPGPDPASAPADEAVAES